MEKQTKEHQKNKFGNNIHQLNEDGTCDLCIEMALDRGYKLCRTQAISEFKEKLIKRIAPDKLHRKWNEDVLEIIEKTAQEMTG